MMKINFKDEAQKYLADKIPAGSTVILTTDDGSNKYSSLGGSCAIGDKFQLVILKDEDPKYTVPIENNAGYNMSTASQYTDFFTDGLNISLWHNALALKDNSGILDGALSVVDWRNVKSETAEQRKNKMVKLGDQIC
nr:iron-sulfur cluster biosynthesis family protein [Companilactobacillus alimentarius]